MRIFYFVTFIMLCLPLTAQHNVIEPTYKTDYTFAIVVDSQTFEACKKEITAYRNAIENEGKATYILYDLWESPQQVRTALKDLYTNKNLEGAVFVGDIPIPMIRRAQHLTSAFKMDQEAYPMYDSSVPSDRLQSKRRFSTTPDVRYLQRTYKTVSERQRRICSGKTLPEQGSR